MKHQVRSPRLTNTDRGWRVRWRCYGATKERLFQNRREAMRLVNTIDEAIDRGLPFDHATGLPITDTPDQVTIIECARHGVTENKATWSAGTLHLKLDNLSWVLARIGFNKTVDSLKERRAITAYLEGNDDALDNLNAEPVGLDQFTGPKLLLQRTVIFANAKNKPVARTAESLRVASLHLIANAAVQIGALDYNPVPNLSRPLSAQDRADSDLIANLPTLEEAKAAIATLPDLYRLASTVLLHTGLRPGELLGLQKKHVDGNKLSIVQAYKMPKARMGGQVTGLTKTGKSRTVYLPDTVTADLATHIDNLNADDFLFHYESPDAPVSVGHLSRLYKRYDIPFTPYDLRHLFHSVALSNGVAVADLCALTGNSPSTVYKVYAHAVRSAEDVASQIHAILTSEDGAA